MTPLSDRRFCGGLSAVLLVACGNPTSVDGDNNAALGSASSSSAPSGSAEPNIFESGNPTPTGTDTGPFLPVAPPTMSQSAPIGAPSNGAPPSGSTPSGTAMSPQPSTSETSAPPTAETSPVPSVSESAESNGGGGAPSLGGNAGQGLGGFASGGDTTAPNTGGAESAGDGGMGPSTPAELTETVIWIAGDSTVASGGNSCPAGWGGQFEALFNDLVKVTNSAVGGRSVRTWLYNVQAVKDEATQECVLDRDANGDPTLQGRWQAMLDGMAEGHTLLVQFGINDGSATCDRHVGLEAFKESYGMMAAAAKERGTQPIFLTPVSAVACNGDTARGTRGSYVTATIEAGEEFDVPVIDLHQLSVDLYDARGFCPIPGGDVSAATGGDVGAFFCDDHTHFDTAGAIDIAALVAQALREQNLALAAYLAE